MTEILITLQIHKFMLIQKQRLVGLLWALEWQKTEYMHVAVFAKM